MSGASPALQFVAWGTYDTGKPRVRLLLDALREKGLIAAEIHVDVWRGIEDKSVAGKARILATLVRIILGYPQAVRRLLLQSRKHAIILLYPAFLDIFVVLPVARLRGQKVVFDAFIPLYDTIVCDRKRIAPHKLFARLLWHFERLMLGLADIIIVDTDAHGQYFAKNFGIPAEKFVTVLVGAEALFWDARHTVNPSNQEVNLPSRYVLFYGQLIPLHGMKTILEAVLATVDDNIHWLIVGSGQEEELVREFMRCRTPTNMTWLAWVEYQSLPALVRDATVCLGVFGESHKAARVIPNKMFQILACGSTIITQESPAVAELAQQFPYAIKLVPPGDARALAKAVVAACQPDMAMPVPESARRQLSAAPGVEQLTEAFSNGGR